MMIVGIYVKLYEQKEMHLDEALVLQQLRYTGMLETVRIRRSGYGAKYTFQVLQTCIHLMLILWSASGHT